MPRRLRACMRACVRRVAPFGPMSGSRRGCSRSVQAQSVAAFHNEAFRKEKPLDADDAAPKAWKSSQNVEMQRTLHSRQMVGFPVGRD